MLHLSPEFCVRIGLNGEADRIAARHLADICLIDLRLDLHLAEVLGDGEELRRLEARGDGLSHLHDFVDDDAVDRRTDIDAVKIDARAVERSLMLSQRRLGILDICFGDCEVCGGALLGGDCRIERGLRGRALPDKLLGASEI